MERGKVVDIADPPSIARQYNELNFRRVRVEAAEQGGPEVLRRAPVAELLGAWFESPDGEQLFEVAHGEDCRVRMEVRFHTDTEDPMFAIALRNDLGHTVVRHQHPDQPRPDRPVPGRRGREHRGQLRELARHRAATG